MGRINKAFFERFNINKEYDIFFETGTCNGDAILTLLNNHNIFKEYHSVEIDQVRFNNCLRIFNNYNNVKLYQGDSSEVLKNNLGNVEYKDKHLFFWLDAHWMGDSSKQGSSHCPLLDELETIKQLNVKPTIVIDDMFYMLNRDDDKYKNPEKDSYLNIASQWPILDDIKNKLYEINSNYDIILSLIEGQEDYLIAK